MQFSLVVMLTARFSLKHSHQRIILSRSILPKVKLSCRDVEVLVEKTYGRWRARSGLRPDKAGGRLAAADRWLKYNFLPDTDIENGAFRGLLGIEKMLNAAHSQIDIWRHYGGSGTPRSDTSCRQKAEFYVRIQLHSNGMTWRQRTIATLVAGRYA